MKGGEFEPRAQQDDLEKRTGEQDRLENSDSNNRPAQPLPEMPGVPLEASPTAPSKDVKGHPPARRRRRVLCFPIPLGPKPVPEEELEFLRSLATTEEELEFLRSLRPGAPNEEDRQPVEKKPDAE
jgi:hypothetical protein